jgi:UDP-glucose 4-epimerase
MMEKDQSDFFNLGTGKGYSVKEVIQKAEEVTGKKVPVVKGPRRPGDPPELVAQSKKANELLGWKPVHSDLENILKTAWVWHQNYFGKKTSVHREDAKSAKKTKKR